jgi:lipoprotein-releasing system permease protein
MVSLSVIAVAISVALLIVVSSLFSGFIGVFEQSAVEAIGDVIVFPPIQLENYPDFIQRLEQISAVDSATPVLSANGLVHLGKDNVRPVSIWGIDPVSRARVTKFKESLIGGTFSNSEELTGALDSDGTIKGFVGIAVLAEPDEKTDEYNMDAVREMIGSTIVLTTGIFSQGQSDDQKGPQISRKTLKFTIEDVVFSGVYDLDQRLIYIPIDKLQELLYPKKEVPVTEQIQIKVSEHVDTETALAQIRGLWADFAEKQLGWNKVLINQTMIVTAKELQKDFVVELYKQMGILLLIFGVVSSGVVVLIFCIFYMIVETRQKDIAIIKSCGTSNWSVVSIFVGLGCCVGIIGSIAGIIFAYFITININPNG